MRIFTRILRSAAVVAALLAGPRSFAVLPSFASSCGYSSTQPAATPAGISNWTGATFDAGNVGGSGVNADGGTANGTTHDASTVVSVATPAQGQTFLTGPAAKGYDLTAITVRLPGYTSNLATGGNRTSWNFNPTNGPVRIRIGKVDGTTFSLRSIQYVMAGDEGSPGSGTSANGPGTFLTFTLGYPVHLEPGTTYGFDIGSANNNTNTLELLGTRSDPYPSGTAYSSGSAGAGNLVITPLAGDRVFLLNLAASAVSAVAFAHPGILHTQSDLDRMKAKVLANAQPWKADYDLLIASKYAQTTRTPAAVATIVRGPSGNNYTRSQEDAVTIYQLALRYHLTGNAAYANRAVVIANAWSSTLTGLSGDSNVSLATGICGFQFAVAAELLSTYPGWAAADRQAFKDMMMRVFYPANDDFLWRHHNTYLSQGPGNTHYRLNWDTCNMASILAIGILCDNRTLYNQAIDYFKNGPGNGRIERAAWYTHPDGSGQTEESGRDQGHNTGGWDYMARFCQAAWCQGDDLYAYDNNRVLRGLEYVARYNLGFDVPYIPSRNSSNAMNTTELVVSPDGRGNLGPMYEMVYNHYVNIKGIAAPYSRMAAERVRPEPGPNTGIHPSQVDWMGFGTLTFTVDPIVAGALPGGLRAHRQGRQVTLNWWGSAHASGYNIKRSNSSGGPYTTIGTTDAITTTFTDPGVLKTDNCFYVVSAINPGGESANSTEVSANRSLVTRYDFEGNANDAVGIKHAVTQGSPAYVAGRNGGQAISLDGLNDHVKLPAGVTNYQDVAIATWVYWNGGSNHQRIFDIGSEIEKGMFLTPNNGSGMRFTITTTRGNEGTAVLTTTALPTARWTHVAVTINSGTATLYVNGVPKSSGTFAGDPLFPQLYCYIGKSLYPADPNFNGRIDDFRIYNHSLSGAEIWNLWGQSANHPPVFSSDQIDRSGAGRDLPYSNAVQTLAGTATDADSGSALAFSKVSGPDWLAVASNGALSGVPTAPGSDRFVVRVTDPAGATDDATLTIDVTEAGMPPELAAPRLVAEGGTMRLSTASSSPGWLYQLQRSFTLPGNPWLDVGSPKSGNGVPLTFDDVPPANEDRCFYRIRISPP